LKVILLVVEEELPLVEAITHISFLMLLTIGNEIQPVLDDFAELDETPPAIKHLGL
jgi:hypothetical protein